VGNIFPKLGIYGYSVTQDEVEEALFSLLSYEDSVGARETDLTLFDDLCLLYTKRFGYSNIVEVAYPGRYLYLYLT
jgi:hypothetical protein